MFLRNGYQKERRDDMIKRAFWGPIVLGVFLLLFASRAQADFSADLYLGADFNWIPLTSGTLGGGSIGPSTLNGVALPWVYCIGRVTTVYVPGDYGQTYVNTTTGMVYDNQFGPANSLNQVFNAPQVAFLLATYAGKGEDQVALQAAIWHVIDPTVSLSNTSGSYADYLAYLTGVGSGDPSQFEWLSPGIGTQYYQGLITAVPIPAAVWLLGSGLLGLVGRRRFRN
jgi:hypothetical protein